MAMNRSNFMKEIARPPMKKKKSRKRKPKSNAKKSFMCGGHVKQKGKMK